MPKRTEPLLSISGLMLVWGQTGLSERRGLREARRRSQSANCDAVASLPPRRRPALPCPACAYLDAYARYSSIPRPATCTTQYTKARTSIFGGLEGRLSIVEPRPCRQLPNRVTASCAQFAPANRSRYVPR
ncbi:hypothetical protein BS50DRAFT_137134 [Corynespora cassiicola Philippines]|uniref:Uncharacterized protein n=1 Tax=Corynespora cassiicola Philippines TaxID=1448308 RepID=A0A2T2N9H4_CORCC|nr:hypothetical protein BS50DRAFT_137134 [Corynespora cassiicola Philippines]